MPAWRRTVSIAEGSSRTRTSRSNAELRLADGRDAPLHVVTEQPLGIRLVVHEVQDADERRPLELGELGRHVHREVDPTDDAEHELRRRRDREQVAGLVERLACLHHDGPRDAVLARSGSRSSGPKRRRSDATSSVIHGYSARAGSQKCWCASTIIE